MRSMASLCPTCIKIFDLRNEELQAFLQSYNGDQKNDADGKANDLLKLILLYFCILIAHETEAKESNSNDSASENEVTDYEPVSKRSKPSSSPSGSHEQEGCCPEVKCVACLGLLEEQYIQHLASAITEHVHHTCMIGMDTYCLSIHVPISLSIRRIGLEACAKKQNPNLDSGTELPKNKSESNYVKEELRARLRRMLDGLLSPLKCGFECPLMISIELDHKVSLHDCIGLKKLHPKFFPRPKKRRHFKRKKTQQTSITSLPVQRALEEITETDLVKEGFFLSQITTPCSHKVEILHKSIFVAGRYNKYSRTLPQTPWVVDGVRKAETSVQELISPPIITAFRASNVRFSSSGREDVDVLMLGEGRPFLLELINPMNVSLNTEEMQKIQEDINSRTSLIAVRMLKRVSKDSSNLLKQGEEVKRKTYSALVWAKGEMTEDKVKVLEQSVNLVIKQRTPIRVLHRRTLAVREKTVFSMETELLDAHHFKLKLVTQAGTYIKEFVHGDFGRTQPNVGTLLGCDADILSLDVLDVQLEWPPGNRFY